ncbi:Uncharacterised protein [Clostridioides difficile]|uniref:hypothetical protein n=1 Tax=Clostridioides difficile TaxID=1496 RepID=UPI001024FFD5|nr:hypothetical protein [Clostridioides difficile]VFF93633.1 Uncharacterised protein [Clostridioides difficile]VIG16386.1 Uncharacterised protein [Clostridioides difficile]HBF4774165.1 hypothetical protein [Clostridioides difficile]HBF5038812.1 hypothetical protein [Clostridioides difficile]HBF5411807.1 hypothetical protein [Clostridioides difficile]
MSLRKIKDKKLILIIFLSSFVVFILLVFYFMIFNNPKKAEYNISENIKNTTKKNENYNQSNKKLDEPKTENELDEIFYTRFPRIKIPKIVDDKVQNHIYIYSLSLSSNFYITYKNFSDIQNTKESIDDYKNLLDTCIASCKSNLDALNEIKKLITGDNKEIVKQLIKDYESYTSYLQSQRNYIDNNIKKGENSNLDFLGKFYEFEDFKDIVSKVQRDLPLPNNDNAKAFQEYEEYNLSKNI